MRLSVIALSCALCVACGDGDRPLVFSPEADWPEAPPLPQAEGGRLVLSNANEDTLSFLEATTLDELARVPIGRIPVELEGPSHLAASPDGRFLWVSITNTSHEPGGPHGPHGDGSVDGFVQWLDARTGLVLGEARTGRLPSDLRLDPDGAFLWGTHFENADAPTATSPLVSMNAETMERSELEVCAAAGGIAFTPDGRRAFVVCIEDEIAVVDLAERSVTRVDVSAATVGASPRFIAVSPLDGSLWVSILGHRDLSVRVLDPDDLGAPPRVVVPFDASPRGIAFADGGRRAYTITRLPVGLVELDGEAPAIRRTVPLEECEQPVSVLASPDGSTVWVVCEGDHYEVPGTVVAFDTATLEETGRGDAGLQTTGAAYLAP